MKKILITLLATVLLWSGYSIAQKNPSLALITEEIDEDITRCGITKSAITSIAALTLRNNGVQVVENSSLPYLHVALTGLPTASGCAVVYRVSIRAFPPLVIATGSWAGFKPRKGNYASLLLCNAGGVVTMNRGSTLWSQSLEQEIKLCLGNLDY